MDVHLHYDIVCPFARLAAMRLPELCARAGATLHWHPVLLGGVYRSIGAPDAPITNPNRARITALDLARQAERAGTAHHWHPRHPVRSVEAMRLLVATPEAARPALSLALFDHVHVHGGDVDRDGLAPFAARAGVALDVLDDPAVKDALRANTEAAVQLGAWGVPTIVIGDRVWFGNDRLDDVARALGVPPLAPAGGPWTRDRAASLTFFHDLASPFSYLAAHRVEALARDHGADLTWAPFLLGALFQGVGAPMVPMATFPAPKQAGMLRDLLDTAARVGAPFQWPSAFPLRTVLPLRVCLVAPQATLPLYRAAWGDDRDIGQPEVVAEVLTDLQLDAPAVLAEAQTPPIKAALRANTERAGALGACGAPTFLVDDRWLFWGQDRMDMVADCLDGWQPRDG